MPRFHTLPTTLTLVLSVLSPPQVASQDLSDIRQRFDRLNEKLLATQADKPLDNVDGGIAWGASYQMDAYLDMYEATVDPAYLEHFVRLADQVLAARADKSGTLDYRGRITFGWPSGGHYTLGKQVILRDKAGEPSIQVRTIGRSYNNKTSIEILEATREDQFGLRIIDSRKAEQPIETTFENLDLETVEGRVNPAPGET
ncbi:MAG: hypothetical protein KC978_24055, partial [Candidatus Omnitrophica bacterium]|nr:hypothetical protein [Candidatus Omnitrophota bacterium]